MRGAWVASFFNFVFDGVSRFRQQGSCWYWTPSFRWVSYCISFVSIARNVVTCEHVIKHNVILHRVFFVQKNLRFTPTYSKVVSRGVWTENTDNAVPNIYKVFVVWIRLLFFFFFLKKLLIRLTWTVWKSVLHKDGSSPLGWTKEIEIVCFFFFTFDEHSFDDDEHKASPRVND